LKLKNSIELCLKSEGVNFFGVADLTSTNKFIEAQGGRTVSKYPKAISIGIKLPNSIIDELPNRQQRAVAVNYMDIYDTTNRRLDIITAKISDILQEEGYDALPVPASERYHDEHIAAIFSHKLAANKAGLGWIGKSCLLITPESGPRVRWASVLTDSPVKVSDKPLKEQCGDCTECVDICPVNAFTGRTFHEKEPREVRYDARKCEEYLGHDDGNQGNVCGLCIYACPHGQK
jgi:epoxyqueuosine reductase